MNGKLSIIMSVILVTAAILTVQSLSMLQNSYAQSRLDATSQREILDIHNREREAVGVPPLTWSDTLADEAWADERRNYVPGTPIDPGFGYPSRFYSHYTQMVWRDTHEFGCGFAQRDFSILVCRYS